MANKISITKLKLTRAHYSFVQYSQENVGARDFKPWGHQGALLDVTVGCFNVPQG